jgi:hypothetical protein
MGTDIANGCYNVMFFPSDLATRLCSDSGMWLDGMGRKGPDPSWTNFTDCFTPELTKVIEGFYANISGTFLV